MAIVTVIPESGSIVQRGDTISIEWSGSPLPQIFYRSPGQEADEIILTGTSTTVAYGAGYTGSNTIAGGNTTMTFSRNAGWTEGSFNIVVFDFWTTGDEFIYEYRIVAEEQYPPDMTPFTDPVEGTGFVEFLNDIGDVAAANPSDLDVLGWDDAAGVWTPRGAATPGPHVLSFHTDVTLTSPADNQVLTYDSGTGQWVNANAQGGGAQSLASVIETAGGGALDNTVLVPATDPIIFSDNGQTVTPLTLTKLSSINDLPALQIDTAGTSVEAIQVDSNASNYGLVVTPSTIRFQDTGGTGVYGIACFGTDDTVELFAEGELAIKSGTFGTGRISIGTNQMAPVGQFTITDSSGSLGTSGQVLTADGSGDSTWENISTTVNQSLDEVITLSPIDNQVYVPVGQGVEFLNQDAADSSLTVVQNYVSTTVPALLVRSASGSTPCIIAEAISGGLGIDIDPTSIRFKPETSPVSPTFRYIRPENVTRSISADDVVVGGGTNLGTGAGGTLLLGGGSGVGGVGGDVSIYPGASSTTSGAILIGTVTIPSAITIRDSAGSTGLDNEVLTSDGAGNSTWEPSTAGHGTTASIDDHDDVDIVTDPVAEGDVLVWRTDEFVPETPASGHGTTSSIDDHSDVDTTTSAPAEGETLVWRTSEFVPENVDVQDTVGVVGGFSFGAWQFIGSASEAVTQGEFSTNNATPGSVTSIKIHYQGHYDSGSQTMFTSAQHICQGDRLIFSCPNSSAIAGDPAGFTLRVSGAASESSGQVTIPVTVEAVSGTAYETTLYYSVDYIRTHDHDELVNYVAAEHVDWAGASAGSIHTSNIAEFSGGANIGLVPDATGSTTAFLKGDGTWDTPGGTGNPSLDTVITGADTTDNDVSVPAANPVIFRDGAAASVTPLTLERTGSGTDEVLSLNTLNGTVLLSGSVAGTDTVDLSNTGLIFDSGTSTVTLGGGSSGGTGGADLILAAQNKSTTGTAGDTYLEAGNGTTGATDGEIYIGTTWSAGINIGQSGSTITITDSTGSTGTDTQVLTVNATGDAQWADSVNANAVTKAGGVTDNNQIARWNGSAGTSTIQESSVILSDTGSLTGVENITLTGTIDSGGAGGARDISADGDTLDALDAANTQDVTLVGAGTQFLSLTNQVLTRNPIVLGDFKVGTPNKWIQYDGLGAAQERDAPGWGEISGAGSIYGDINPSMTDGPLTRFQFAATPPTAIIENEYYFNTTSKTLFRANSTPAWEAVSTNLEVSMYGAAQHEVPVGTSVAGTAVYRELTATGAVKYDRATEGFTQASFSDLDTKTHNHEDAAGGTQLTAAALTSTALSGLTEEVSPAAGDLLLLQATEGLRKLDINNLPAGSEVNNLESSCGDIQNDEVFVGTSANTGTYILLPTSGLIKFNGTAFSADTTLANLNTTLSSNIDESTDARPADEIETSGTNVTISGTAPSGSGEYLLTTSATQAAWTALPLRTMSITIEDPAAETILMGRVPEDVTISRVDGVWRGGSGSQTASVTIESGATQGTQQAIHVNAQTCTSNTTGNQLTVGTSSITNSRWIWVTLASVTTDGADAITLTVAYS